MNKSCQRGHLTEGQRARYRELTAMLRKYPSLKLFSEKAQEEIEYIEKGLLPIPRAYREMAGKEGQEAARAQYAAEKKRRKRYVECQIEKIEAAIEAVRNQRGSEMLELKFLVEAKRMTDEDIMEIMNVSRSTFYRYRNELLSKMSLIYFGKG